MFLFDIFRSSRQKQNTGNKIELRWKTFLPSNPVFCAESTAIIDQEKNFYFGSHSGNFYSLTSDGKIRWSFYTKAKIYGSPLFCKDDVIFASGDGWLYSLKCSSGDVNWKFDLKKGYYDSFKQKLLETIIHFPYTFNFVRKLQMDTKCWSSPMLINDKIYITAYGKGFYCINEEGNEEWSVNLGFPRYQLSGVVADSKNNIYFVSRKGKLYSYSINGERNWIKNIGNYNVWGNPSFDDYNFSILIPESLGEAKGLISCYSTNGVKKWQAVLKSAIYGSVAIDNNREYYYCSDFAGYIYKIDSKNGRILLAKQLSQAVRALWTTPTIDEAGFIYITTKDRGENNGRIIKMDQNFELIWEYKLGKALSVPVILENGDICAGSWDGYYYCLKTL